MNLICKLCGKRVVVTDNIVPGQHVRCPFCGGKFSYTIVSNREKDGTGQPEAKGLSRQRCRSLGVEALISAIVIAAVVCCGMFACRAYERLRNDNVGRPHEIVPQSKPESSGENANLEFGEKMEGLGKCIAEGRNKANLLNIGVENALKLVKVDWERMVNALSRVVTANNYKALDARMSGRARFNRAELAISVFNSKVFRELYRRYGAEDREDVASNWLRHITERVRKKDQLCQSDVEGIESMAESTLRDVLKKLVAAMQKRCAGLEKLQDEIDMTVCVVNDAEAVGNDANSSLAQIEKAIMDVRACDFGRIENGLARLEVSEDYFLEIGVDLSDLAFVFDGDNDEDAFAFSIAEETNNVAVVSNRMDKGEVQTKGADKISASELERESQQSASRHGVRLGCEGEFEVNKKEKSRWSGL